jgi:caa(3)-type oxidase subunit IV
MASNSSSHTHEHHIVSTSTYFLTLVALVVLMVITVAIAQWNIPGFWIFSGTVVNQLVALVIATIKALLVITIFMGVKWGTTLTKLWVIAGFVTLPLLFGILGDYCTRKYEQQPGWEKIEDGALPRISYENPTKPPADSSELNVKIRQ